MKSLLRPIRKHASRRLSTVASPTSLYTCGADVEPLHRYKPGGYHPVHIGDTLGGRYKILHKLGWGGYSTVWAAQDLLDQKCFALKAVVAEKKDESREVEIMQAIASSGSSQRHPGHRFLRSLHDHFQLEGPNGRHDCLVMDITGPNVQTTVERRFGMGRLPARLVKRFSKQIALGVACLHQQGIGHADLHTGNIVLAGATTQAFSDASRWRDRGEPLMSPVERKDHQPIGPEVPKYLVESVSLPLKPLSTCFVKIADFGEAFSEKFKPTASRTPLVFRTPEAVFNDEVDLRIDLWSLGCMYFELLTGQPPFDSILLTPTSLSKQMLESTGQTLPQRWHAAWTTMSDGMPFAIQEDVRLQDWLEELYFDDEAEPEFSREDIKSFGRMIQKLLRLEPAERASAEEILKDPWFQDCEEEG